METLNDESYMMAQELCLTLCTIYTVKGAAGILRLTPKSDFMSSSTAPSKELLE